MNWVDECIQVNGYTAYGTSTSNYLLILHSCGWPKCGHHMTGKGMPHTFSVYRKENLNLSNTPPHRTHFGNSAFKPGWFNEQTSMRPPAFQVGVVNKSPPWATTNINLYPPAFQYQSGSWIDWNFHYVFLPMLWMTN